MSGVINHVGWMSVSETLLGAGCSFGGGAAVTNMGGSS